MYEKQLKDILNRLTLIGSRAWGGYSEKSDYDFIISTKIESKIFDLLYALSIDFTNEQNYEGNNLLFNTKNVKFTFNNKIINLLFYSDSDYPKIDLVANSMMSLSKMKHFDNNIKDKKKRHKLFETLVETVFEQKEIPKIEDYETPLGAMSDGPIKWHPER